MTRTIPKPRALVPLCPCALVPLCPCEATNGNALPSPMDLHRLLDGFL